MKSERSQDKQEEIGFFNAHAASAEYDVFTSESNERLIAAAIRIGGFQRGAHIVDLGCGSGVFTDLLQRAGFSMRGVDISPKLIELGRTKYPKLELIEGDAENLPFDFESIDGAVLSNLVHHFPDPRRLASEVHRILKPSGRFVAFDPNRLNPFMWLYRDHASPFYSPIGVTANERPILPWRVAEVFRNAGFRVQTDYLGGIAYRYVASGRMRALLPIYNAIDNIVFRPPFMKTMRPFAITSGEKSR